MALQFRIGVAARDDACDGIVDGVDAGGTGYFEIRTGAAPATPATASSGTLLATCACSATAFDDAGSAGGNADGVATAETITSDTDADDSGEAGYFRLYSGGAVVVAQGTCADSGADLNFDDATIVAGGTVAITGFTITVPME